MGENKLMRNMGHDLRTPLNHIKGFTELLLDKKVGELNEQQEEYLRDVLDSSHLLMNRIDNLLIWLGSEAENPADSSLNSQADRE